MKEVVSLAVLPMSSVGVVASDVEAGVLGEDTSPRFEPVAVLEAVADAAEEDGDTAEFSKVGAALDGGDRVFSVLGAVVVAFLAEFAKLA